MPFRQQNYRVTTLSGTVSFEPHPRALSRPKGLSTSGSTDRRGSQATNGTPGNGRSTSGDLGAGLAPAAVDIAEGVDRGPGKALLDTLPVRTGGRADTDVEVVGVSMGAQVSPASIPCSSPEAGGGNPRAQVVGRICVASRGIVAAVGLGVCERVMGHWSAVYGM